MSSQFSSQPASESSLSEEVSNSFFRLRSLAEDEAIKILLAKEKKLGIFNPISIPVKDQLAAIYMQRQMISEAQKVYLAAWDLHQGSLGVAHPETLDTLRNLASTYCKQGIWSTAENLENQILRMCERATPKDEHSIMDSLCTMAWINERMDRFFQAEKYAKQAYDISQTVLGDTHPFSLEIENLLLLLRRKSSLVAASQTTLLSDGDLDDIDSVINRIKSTSTVVGRNTEVDEVFTHLIDRGCNNYTGELNMSEFGISAVAGGTFGDVYRGKLSDQTEVAAKCLRVHAMDNTFSKDIKRAARELYYWSKVKHENVLNLMGVAMFRGQLPMISLWMQNGTLRDYVAKNPSADRWKLCIQVARGLAHVHQCNIIHGDLKGKNILVSDQEVVKLNDFGNAILTECSLAFTDTTQKGGGTTRWMAPELLDDDETKPPERSKEADVYALGMTILVGGICTTCKGALLGTP